MFSNNTVNIGLNLKKNYVVTLYIKVVIGEERAYIFEKSLQIDSGEDRDVLKDVLTKGITETHPYS